MSILFSKNFSTGSFVRPQGYTFPVGLSELITSNTVVDYLVVAGGGGGGGDINTTGSGGGGAGGLELVLDFL